MSKGGKNMEGTVGRWFQLQAGIQRATNELLPKRKPNKEPDWFDINPL